MTGAEALIEQGIERGARETLVHNIFTVLSERFSQAEVEPVRASLETVSDLTMLTELFRFAVTHQRQTETTDADKQAKKQFTINCKCCSYFFQKTRTVQHYWK